MYARYVSVAQGLALAAGPWRPPGAPPLTQALHCHQMSLTDTTLPEVTQVGPPWLSTHLDWPRRTNHRASPPTLWPRCPCLVPQHPGQEGKWRERGGKEGGFLPGWEPDCKEESQTALL